MSTLLIDLAGEQLTLDEVELLEHPLVAGVILFSRNFSEREQLQDLIQSIRRKVKKTLLITVDQEGGRVQRFRQGFTTLPAMQSFAALIEDPCEQQRLAQETGWQMAAEMTALDIDLSFAPVLDLGHQCRAIGDRSFHSEKDKLLALATAYIEGMHEIGMSATGKHFPGHGHVLADSHLETPFDNRPQEQIFAQDIQPFHRLIVANKLQAIMPAHVIFTQCDDQPASGSVFWLQQILRQQLGFNGAIFSDDLGMKGAGFMGDFVQRSEKALSAGCDLLLLCNERAGVEQVLDNLKFSENAPHFHARQARLQRLFKQQTFDWDTLTSAKRWQRNYVELSALQERWLAEKSCYA